MASDGPTSAEEWREDPTDSTCPQTPEHQESQDRDEEGVKVCPFFRMGKCHFGNRCRLSHSDPATDCPAAFLPVQDDEKKAEKLKQTKGNMYRAAKPKDHEEVNKKPRMRTADDVISRILWDPSVDASAFVVGYVDRFLGVLERPFADFNWERDPCDCDYTTELALPRHRIQYFTYGGRRIWDRHSRTDRVFGSTGQSLAPPFGGEEEVEESDPEAQERLAPEGDSPQTSGDEPPAVGGKDEKTHLEEGKQNALNVHAPDSAQPAPECGGATAQEHGARVVEEAADSLSPSADGSQEEEAEWAESWEGHDNTLSYATALSIIQDPSAPPGPRDDKRSGGRPPKKRPTHFITFRANTPSILTCFQLLQEELVSLLPSSAPHWLSSSYLHVTLCLLVLPGAAEVAAAEEILRQFARLDRNPPVALTFPVKLKHFNGRVLFLSPQPHLHLQQLNSGLQEAYRAARLLHRDSYNPRYHLTLAKVTGREGERVFQGVSDLKVGKGLNFGRLPVNTLHLCAIGGSQEDGFYETVCSVSLR